MFARYLSIATSLVISTALAFPALAERGSGRIDANPPIAATELAQIWQSLDCTEAGYHLVATVSADVVAEEVEKYGGCTTIVYIEDNSDQAIAPMGAPLAFFTPPIDNPRRTAGGGTRLM